MSKRWDRFDHFIVPKPGRSLSIIHPEAADASLAINGLTFDGVLHLYHAMRMSHLPERQRRLFGAGTGRRFQRLGLDESEDCRNDWHEIKVDVMYWCQLVKLAQHPCRMANALFATGDRPLLLCTPHDTYWGASGADYDRHLRGGNVLGWILQDIRDQIVKTGSISTISTIDPPYDIPGFHLLGAPVEPVALMKG